MFWVVIGVLTGATQRLVGVLSTAGLLAAGVADFVVTTSRGEVRVARVGRKRPSSSRFLWLLGPDIGLVTHPARLCFIVLNRSGKFHKTKCLNEQEFRYHVGVTKCSV